MPKKLRFGKRSVSGLLTEGKLNKPKVWNRHRGAAPLMKALGDLSLETVLSWGREAMKDHFFTVLRAEEAELAWSLFKDVIDENRDVFI